MTTKPPIPDVGAVAPQTAFLRDGTQVVIRSIREDDMEHERSFIEHLSPRVRRFRFLDTISSPSAALLRQLTVVDPAKGVAYVAMTCGGAQEQQVGVARFCMEDGADCEFAIVVDDAWQNKGLGTLLMQRLIEEARARGIDTLHSSDYADNDLMRRFAAYLQLQRQRDPQDATLVLYRLNVRPTMLKASAPDRGAPRPQAPDA